MSILSELGLASVFAALAAVPAEANELVIVEKPDHVSEAVITLDATPAEVYAAVTDYAGWQALLGDVSNVKVESGGPRDARVRFSSRAFGRAVTVQFDNVPDRTIRFRGVEGPPGGRAHGSYELEPIDGGRQTRVVADLYLDVVGLPGAFVSDSKIRSMREAKLRADMADVIRHFSRH